MQILYATDGSEGAIAAVSFLARLALSAADEVRMLRVTPGAAHEDTEFAPERAALRDLPVRIETEVRAGAPEEQILRYAAERGADLIALGAMGRPRLSGFMMGGVAQRVLRHTQVPVLVARPLRHGLRTAVAGVAPTGTGQPVIEAAARFPLPPGVRLLLCSVLPPDDTVASVAPAVWAAMSGEMDRLLHDKMTDTEERLRALAQPLQAAGRAVSAEILRGDPLSQLLSCIERSQADLAVAGYQGQEPVDRLVLGSVAEKLAHDAPCSVLVVR